jgi:hypothetical protein
LPTSVFYRPGALVGKPPVLPAADRAGPPVLDLVPIAVRADPGVS